MKDRRQHPYSGRIGLVLALSGWSAILWLLCTGQDGAMPILLALAVLVASGSTMFILRGL